MGWDLVLVAAVLIAYASVSGRLRRSPVTPAIVFAGAGYVLGGDVLDLVDSGLDSGGIRVLAEATLALVLFADAASLDVGALRREAVMPLRLLAIGLPLTIVLGTLVAVVLLPGLGVFEAVVLAVVLAPTDAALGQIVVSDERLPSRLRQGLNVESGLNDGICVPLLFAAIAFAEVDESSASATGVLGDLVAQVGIGAGVGVAVGIVVAVTAAASRRRGWLDGHWAQLIPLATVVIAYVATDELGGSGFIGAFSAGVAYRFALGASVAHRSTLLTDEIGGLLSAVTFFVFGASLIGQGVVDLDLATVAYALLSLTVVRMLPVALSLIGSRSAPQTVAFAGWFGPRGLASIVFLLVIVEEAALPGTPIIIEVGTVTVLLSVLAHGLSATPLTDRYVGWLAGRRERLRMESEEAAPGPGMMRRSPWRRSASSGDSSPW